MFTGRLKTMLTIDQMKSIVYHIRHVEWGSWEGTIKSSPYMFVSDVDHRQFLQFDLYFHNQKTLSNERMIGWAHPDLIFLVQGGPVNIFIDCTFKVVPSAFMQLMIIMVYSKHHDLYVPVYYILLQSKKEDSYFNAIEQAINASNWKLEALTVTCDFEMALINAIKDQFPEGKRVLCLFHWKQALRRKLRDDYKLPEEIVHLMTRSNGLLELLTVIPIEEIIQYGIPYIRSQMQIEEQSHKGLLDKFWTYFSDTWLKRYDPKDWNVHHLKQNQAEFNSDDNLINRTNNPLERYNKTMNAAFGHNGHPSMIQFLTQIRSEACNYSKTLDCIRKKVQRAPPHQPCHYMIVPEQYYMFRNTGGLPSSSPPLSLHAEQQVVGSNYSSSIQLNATSSFNQKESTNDIAINTTSSPSTGKKQTLVVGDDTLTDKSNAKALIETVVLPQKRKRIVSEKMRSSSNNSK